MYDIHKDDLYMIFYRRGIKKKGIIMIYCANHTIPGKTIYRRVKV